jgi:hypothetical protein
LAVGLKDQRNVAVARWQSEGERGGQGGRGAIAGVLSVESDRWSDGGDDGGSALCTGLCVECLVCVGLGAGHEMPARNATAAFFIQSVQRDCHVSTPFPSRVSRSSCCMQHVARRGSATEAPGCHPASCILGPDP